jgi:hypothetical protein
MDGICSTQRIDEKYKILFGKLKENIGLGGKIILEWILEKWGWRLWTAFVWPRIGTSGVLL